MGACSEGREDFYLNTVPGVIFAFQYKQGYDSKNQNLEYRYIHTRIYFLNLYLNSCNNFKGCRVSSINFKLLLEKQILRKK